jgi:hypothetical protein
MDALIQAPLFLLAVLAGTALLFWIITAPARGNSQTLRRKAQEANSLIAQGEGKLLVGDYAAAESLFFRALPLADGSDALLFSEAYFGVARCAERRGDLQYAAQSIRFALAYAPEWRSDKPNYEQFLNRELRRVLDAIGKASPSA